MDIHVHRLEIDKMKASSFLPLSGFETAKALALHGAHVILACTDMNKASKAAVVIRTAQVC